MNSRRHALAMARCFRTCPPPALTGLPEMHPQIEAHRYRCPLCSDAGTRDPWQSIADRIAGPAALVSGYCEIIKPGQLLAVKAELARWRGDFFYSPPLVLVLALSDTLTGAVQVAQVYHDVLLAAPGDLIIQAPPGPSEPFFIECWNRYTLRCEDLSAPVAVLPETVVQAVVELGRDPAAIPDWAPLPVPLSGENDPRLAFRRMEVEVGFVFASAASEDLVGRMTSGVPELASPNEVQAALKNLIPEIRWPFRSATPDEILGGAQLPDAFYPLAAAGEGVPVFGRRIDVVGGLPASVRPLAVNLTHIEPLFEALAVSGTIEAAAASRLLVAIASPNDAPRLCETVDWSPQTGFFYAELPVTELEGLRIEMTLIAGPNDA